MTKKEIELKKVIDIDESFDVDKDYIYSNPQIIKIYNIKVIGKIKYQEFIKAFDIIASISCDIDAIDGRDGKKITLSEKIEWNDQYLFESHQNEVDNNLILGDEFKLHDYAIDQIIINIPMNLTNNYDNITFVGENWSLHSEDEYKIKKDQETDPRWDKLKDLNLKK